VTIDTGLATIHVVAWATYVGGAITMEVVLRHAQQYMRTSQVFIVCQRAGERYRWFGLASLMLLGLTGAIMVLRIDDAVLAARDGSPALSLADAYGRTLLLLAIVWLVLAAIVGHIAFRAHPAMHARQRAGMTEEEVQRDRHRVGAAVRRMNQLLHLELAIALVALLLGASLRAGGIT
jgi:uncharacterized membrane protein